MPSDTLRPLVDLIRRLRGPDGCPWDREQGLADIRGYLLEEAHEVAAAIDEGNDDEISGELGDLLFHIVFTAELVREAGGASVEQVVERIHDKMVARHPHVFGTEVLTSSDDVHRAWEARKARERATRGDSILDGVATSLPALLAAYRMTQKAAGVGFDWPDVDGVLDKVEEELDEVREAIAQLKAEPTGPAEQRAAEQRATEEVGDLLFATASLARHLGTDPESALAAANLKFRRRFAHIERALAAEGRPLDSATLEELDSHWERAKSLEETPAVELEETD